MDIIDFIIRFTQKGADVVISTFKGIYKLASSIFGVFKGLIPLFNKLRMAAGAVIGTLGPLAPIISAVISLWQMWKERADKAAEAAREALEKQKERLGNMAEALRKWKSAISEKLDLEARLIKERQITAEYKARTEEVKAAVNAQALGDRLRAMREGREEDAARAELDMQLMLGTITEEEHALATFELSKVSSANRYGREHNSATQTLQRATDERTKADSDLKKKQEEETALKAALNNISSLEDWKALGDAIQKAREGITAQREILEDAEQRTERKKRRLPRDMKWAEDYTTDMLYAEVQKRKNKNIITSQDRKRLNRLDAYYRARVAEENARNDYQETAEQLDGLEKRRRDVFTALSNLGYEMHGTDNQDNSIRKAAADLQDLGKQRQQLESRLSTAENEETQAQNKLEAMEAERREEVENEKRKSEQVKTRVRWQAWRKKEEQEKAEEKKEREEATHRAETSLQDAETKASRSKASADKLMHEAETRSFKNDNNKKNWDSILSVIRAVRENPELLQKMDDTLQGKKVKWSRKEAEQVNPFAQAVSSNLPAVDAQQLRGIIAALLQTAHDEQSVKKAKSNVDYYKREEDVNNRADDFHERDMQRIRVNNAVNAAENGLRPETMQIIDSARAADSSVSAAVQGMGEQVQTALNANNETTTAAADALNLTVENTAGLIAATTQNKGRIEELNSELCAQRAAIQNLMC